MLRWSLLILIFCSSLVRAELHEQAVTYRADDTPLKGYLVWDDKFKGKRPGILVVHEFWGLNDYPRSRARQLAALGYAALAVDMYGEGRIGDHPKAALDFMNAVLDHEDIAKARFLAGKEFLQQQPTVDPKKIAAIGYCFGGATVLMMARAGVDIVGVVSFHGMLNVGAPAQPGKVKTRILVETGADDQMATAQDIATFTEQMTAAGAQFHIDTYPGVKHGFTNPGVDALAKQFDLPLAYNADADAKSWTAMQRFFKEIFAK